MKKFITATLLGGAIIGSLLGAGAANANVDYQNCTAVWNDVERPITDSDPGYESKLDSDGDGVACESDPR